MAVEMNPVKVLKQAYINLAKSTQLLAEIREGVANMTSVIDQRLSSTLGSSERTAQLLEAIRSGLDNLGDGSPGRPGRNADLLTDQNRLSRTSGYDETSRGKPAMQLSLKPERTIWESSTTATVPIDRATRIMRRPATARPPRDAIATNDL